MTVIVGALILPYTVKFEVNSADEDLVDPELELDARLPDGAIQTSPDSNFSEISNSILPSLSNANSGSPQIGGGSFPKKDTEGSFQGDFFSKSSKHSSSSGSSGNASHEGQRSHLIQPRSRFSSPMSGGSMVEQKRKSIDGIPAVKYTRSGSISGNSGSFSGRSGSVSGRSGSHSISIDSGNSKSGKQCITRPFIDFSSTNCSNDSAVITEEDDAESPNSFVSSRNRLNSTPRRPYDINSNLLDDEDEITGDLAPYGGFSRKDLKDVVLGTENIFSSAPWKIVRSERGNGSLFKAIDLAVDKGIIDTCKWVGTMSSPSDLIPQNVIDDISRNLSEEYNCEPVSIDDWTYQGHYKSFCKQILWPTLHYQIPDDPKSKAFEKHSYHYYTQVNQLVADKIVETYKKEKNHLDPENPENVIWIHDYHLLLVPAMIRKQCPEARIGFFLHVSFPSCEVFRCLAQRKPLLEGLLGADCICFQNEEYVRSFVQTCNRLLLTDSNELGLIFRGKVTRLQAIPVGIDAPKLENVLKTEGVINWTKLIRERWSGQTLLVSRDKCDKLRGIKQKLLAYERYLIEDRTRVESTVLLQIFMGSAGDEDYETEVQQIISRVNSMADNLATAQPIVVINHDIDFEQYLALLCEADLFIVSSMREGLNLTCHEFIVATSSKKSPLVLSEFTGSSHLLDCDGHGAYLINPWDVATFSKTIGQALGASPAENEERWRNCHAVVLKHDSLDWVESCLTATRNGWSRNQEKSYAVKKPFTKEVFRKFAFKTHKKSLIIINIDDFSGSGINGSNEHKSSIELSRIGTNLAEVLSDPGNYVFFASIRRRSELDLIFKNVPDVGLIAEFGGFIQFPDSTNWISVNENNRSNSDLNQIAHIFQAKANGLPGSKVVLDDCTVRLIASTAMKHDSKRSLDVMGECVQLVNDSYSESDGLQATIVNDSVVVQERHTSLQALKFLYSYYTGCTHNDNVHQRFSLKRMTSSADVFKEEGTPTSSTVHLSNLEGLVDQIFYAGGLSPIDEKIYDFVASLKKTNCIRSGLTVAVWDGIQGSRTSAKYVAMGQNELVSIIADIEQ